MVTLHKINCQNAINTLYNVDFGSVIPLCLLIDMCFYRQSVHSTLNTTHSSVFYNMFRPSSGRNAKTSSSQTSRIGPFDPFRLHSYHCSPQRFFGLPIVLLPCGLQQYDFKGWYWPQGLLSMPIDNIHKSWETPSDMTSVRCASKSDFLTSSIVIPGQCNFSCSREERRKVSSWHLKTETFG